MLSNYVLSWLPFLLVSEGVDLAMLSNELPPMDSVKTVSEGVDLAMLSNARNLLEATL